MGNGTCNICRVTFTSNDDLCGDCLRRNNMRDVTVEHKHLQDDNATLRKLLGEWVEKALFTNKHGAVECGQCHTKDLEVEGFLHADDCLVTRSEEELK